jgi:lipoprotein-releasing system permease protein
MNRRLLLNIIRRHLLAKKKQTIIAALGVTFGIAIFVSMIGFMTGLNGLLDGLMLQNTPHVRMYNELEIETENVASRLPRYRDYHVLVQHRRPKDVQRRIRNAPHILQSLREDERVLGVAPRIMTQAFYVFGATELNGSLVGIDPVQEDRLFDLGSNLIAGSLEGLQSNPNSIVIGSGLAKKLGVGVEDRITVTTVLGIRRQLKIAGIFQIGISAIDDVQSYAAIKTAQELMDQGQDYITDINIKLHNIRQSPDVARELQARYDVKSVDYKTANAQMELGMKVRSIMTYVIAVALLIVAGFGIYNILNMFITEKMDDIAILRATGFRRKDIRRIFIAEALMIGVIGGILGLITGYGLARAIDNVPFEQDFMPALKTLPVNYDIRYYIIGVVFALITTFMAGYLPSRKAGRIDPVDIIRGK